MSIKNCLPQIGLWAYPWSIFWFNAWCGRAQALGGSNSGQVIAGSVRKQAERGKRSKQVKQSSSEAFASVPASRFMAEAPVLTPSVMEYDMRVEDEINPVLLKLILVLVFIT